MDGIVKHEVNGGAVLYVYEGGGEGGSWFLTQCKRVGIDAVIVERKTRAVWKHAG